MPPGIALGSIAHDAAALAVTAGGVVLIAFPAELFNSTLEENYDEIREEVRRRLPRWAPMWRAITAGAAGGAGAGGGAEAQRRGAVLVVAVGAFLGCLLDPRFGWHWASIEAYAGKVLSIVGSLALGGLVAFHYRRFRGREPAYAVRAIPAGLCVAALCVAVSRIAGFEPGYL